MLNNIGSFWRSITGGNPSKEDARSRLQFVLVQDRAGMSSDEMSKFKAELVGVIEKYFKLESEKFDITYKRQGDGTMLLINSPVQLRRALGSSRGSSSASNNSAANNSAANNSASNNSDKNKAEKKKAANN